MQSAIERPRGVDVDRPVLIVGAGIAGLSAALALKRRGIPFAIVERAASLRTGGGGLLVWANGIVALRRLGLDEAVIAAGAPIEATEFRTWHGAPIWQLPVGAMGRRCGAPSIVIARSDLMGVLAGALDRGVVQLGERCTGFTEHGRGVRVEFASGTSIEASSLIAADGIHSAIRARMFGEEPLRSAYQDAWVGIAPYSHASVVPGRAVATVGRGLRFWAAPIRNGRVYWYATVSDAALDGGQPASSKRDLIDLFRSAHTPVADLIDATDDASLIRVRVQDREPLPYWGHGRVTLAGDAAHPTTPDLGQGACQAIEDAVSLSDHLASGAGVAPALRAYERERVRRTARITNLSWAVAVQSAPADPAFCTLRDVALRTVIPRIAEAELGWILRHEP
ncbi:FAD-dependent monooxygenase [Sorangium sp. So ce448]|uniref:FAD-dependent monooxygenase n=1 Tax=Sorangium sp. So ce448 TaxID=3133314 RepID=UPI003F61A9B1